MVTIIKLAYTVRYRQLQITKLLHSFNPNFESTNLKWIFFKWKRKLNFEKNSTVNLQHLSDQCTFTPVDAQGGSMENHFSTWILQWNLLHICTGNNKSQLCKKILKCCNVSKWRPNNQFLFCVISIFGQILKNHFSKGIFQWNLAQRRRISIDLHYWITFKKKIFRFKMVAKYFFFILRNNANLC